MKIIKKYIKIIIIQKKNNYEIRICTFYKGARSIWSDMKKIKTKNVDIDGLILYEVEKGEEYLEKFYEQTG